MDNVLHTTIVILLLFSGLILAVDYCTFCALSSCTNSHACSDEDINNATGCISFWINYKEGLNLSYAGCWEPSLGTCEELVEYEKQQGYDAVCSICYEDNCNFGVTYIFPQPYKKIHNITT